MTRPAYILRDPVSRADAAEWLKHRLKIVDARLRLMRLTVEQAHHYEGEYSALFNALYALTGETFVRERNE